jgi:hypothetical protein
MKIAIKRENGEFLVITHKHASGLKVVVNRPRTPKLWAIAHEKGHKTRKRRFFVITLKHVSGRMVDVKRPRNPKRGTIGHENGHKTRKRRVSGHNSQTCIGS